MAYTFPPSQYTQPQYTIQFPNNATEKVISTLLASHIRTLCYSYPTTAFDEHNSFVGKKRLKAALLERLPLRDLEQAGFFGQKVKELMNELLKDGLTDELIAEGKRRKDSDGEFDDPITTTLPSPRLELNRMLQAPNIPTFGIGEEIYKNMSDSNYITNSEFRGQRATRGRGNSASFVTSDHSRSSSQSTTYQLALNIPRTTQLNTPWLNLNATQNGGNTTYGVLPLGSSRPSTPLENSSSTPLHPALQNHFLTTLQSKLENACYHFVVLYFPKIFARKRAWESCPAAAELTKWTQEISKELHRELDAGMMDNTTYRVEELSETLTALNAVRHDAVHRNPRDAEKFQVYIRDSRRVVGLFRAFGQDCYTKGASDNSPSSIELLAVERDLITIEKALDRAIQHYKDTAQSDTDLEDDVIQKISWDIWAVLEQTRRNGPFVTSPEQLTAPISFSSFQNDCSINSGPSQNRPEETKRSSWTGQAYSFAP